MESVNGVIHVKVNLRHAKTKQNKDANYIPKLAIGTVHRSCVSLAIPSEFSPRLQRVTKTLQKFPKSPIKKKILVSKPKTVQNSCKKKIFSNQENASIVKPLKNLQSLQNSPRHAKSPRKPISSITNLKH